LFTNKSSANKDVDEDNIGPKRAIPVAL
jgi:hypothetical protein